MGCGWMGEWLGKWMRKMLISLVHLANVEMAGNNGLKSLKSFEFKFITFFFLSHSIISNNSRHPLPPCYHYLHMSIISLITIIKSYFRFLSHSLQSSLLSKSNSSHCPQGLNWLRSMNFLLGDFII